MHWFWRAAIAVGVGLVVFWVFGLTELAVSLLGLLPEWLDIVLVIAVSNIATVAVYHALTFIPPHESRLRARLTEPPSLAWYDVSWSRVRDLLVVGLVIGIVGSAVLIHMGVTGGALRQKVLECKGLRRSGLEKNGLLDLE